MKEKSKYPGSSYLKWREQKKEFSKRSYTCSCHSASLQPPYFVAMAALGVASIPYAFFIYFRFREVLWKNLQNHGIIPLLENYNEPSYKKLWKILIDRDMNKSDLIRQAKITSNIVAKMSKGEDVSMESLRKICIALDCEIGDIMEVNAGTGE